jgi:hypothetical protein
MKKFRSLSILLALALVMSLLPSFTVSAAEPGYVYDFYYESDFNNDYTVTGTNQCNVTWEDHALKMVADGLDEIGIRISILTILPMPVSTERIIPTWRSA